MILQELYDYYQRKAADPDGGIAPEGFEWKAIPFLIVLDGEGRFVEIEDTREGEGKSRRSKSFLVASLGEAKGNGIKANFLWENIEYALGIATKESSDPDRVKRQHEAFKEKVSNAVCLPHQGELLAPLLGFFESMEIDRIQRHRLWNELSQPSALVAFRIEGQGPLTDLVRPGKPSGQDENSEVEGVCLISGQKGRIARLHQPIRGVRNANPTGAFLSSVNNKVTNGRNGGETPAFASYMRQQGFNAPVSEASAQAYTKALNALLANRECRVQVGDATTVFWSARKTDFEGQFAALFGLQQKDDPDAEARAVKALYESPLSGGLMSEGDTRFFVLGLAPNAARISVRFWIQDTLASLSMKLRTHLDDLDIVCSPKDPGHRAMMLLLCDLVLGGKADNIPPNLAGAVLRAALTGGPYPSTLLHLAIRRIRAERTVTRVRAAVLKAVLNRAHRIKPTNDKEITVSLDPTNMSPGYRLGRLFSVLEKIQEDAQPGINATIRDRYYGAASTSPASVFPQLLKLKNHHLAKMENGAFRGAHERRLADIFDGLVDMPAHLPMEEQARFAIGYYHQRQALFTKTSKSDSTQA